MHVLERSQRVERPIEEVFAFYANPRNLARITPPWLRFRIVGFEPAADETGDPPMRTGLRIRYRVSPLGVPQTWLSEITLWEPPHRFVDEQLRGPYRVWRHEHGFREAGGATEITDRVEYALPFGPLGRLAHRLLVSRQLEAIFAYRERVVGQLFD